MQRCSDSTYTSNPMAIPALALTCAVAKLGHKDAARARCVCSEWRNTLVPIKKPYWMLGVGDILCSVGKEPTFVKVVKVLNKSKVGVVWASAPTRRSFAVLRGIIIMIHPQSNFTMDF